MKKYLLTLAVITLSATAFSQTKFGVIGGLNLANQKLDMSFEEFSFGQKGKTIGSFHVGAFAEIPLANKFSLRPELLFSGKGCNFEDSEDTGMPDAKLRPYYLDLPVSVIYTHELKSGMGLFAGFGPVISMGLFGNIESEGEKEDYFQDEAFNRLDFGLKYQVGVHVNSKVFLSAHYTQGLANTADVEDQDLDIKWKNNVIGFSLGYYLGSR